MSDTKSLIILLIKEFATTRAVLEAILFQIEEGHKPTVAQVDQWEHEYLDSFFESAEGLDNELDNDEAFLRLMKEVPIFWPEDERD